MRVILDGASEPLGEEPTSLERARTPVLDGLAAEGSVIRLRTVARGLPAGSESAIPALLGGCRRRRSTAPRSRRRRTRSSWARASARGVWTGATGRTRPPRRECWPEPSPCAFPPEAAFPSIAYTTWAATGC